MILTGVILGLFGLFWLAELVAHASRYAWGPTLSGLIWRLEATRWGLVVRIVIGLLVATLFTHLEFQIP